MEPELSMTNDDRILANIETRVSALEREMTAIQTEVRIQFKEVFTRVKRIEAVLITTSGATILILLTILNKMQ
jgi:hypothetical protein